jgi:hypothetical protein
MKRFFEDDGYPQCDKRCVVVTELHGMLCICELISGHSGECERVPTNRLARLVGRGVTKRLPVYDKFVADRKG